jgi:uncharacterized cupin superfamily protein
MQILRIYSDEKGVSHFDEMTPELLAEGDASVNPYQVQSSAVWAATGAQFRVAPPTFTSDFHVAWQRQFVITLSGTLEITTSDGERREVGPDSILLVEDTTGDGHSGNSIGDEPLLWLFVHLDEA